jgi:hypothetical protein
VNILGVEPVIGRLRPKAPGARMRRTVMKGHCLCGFVQYEANGECFNQTSCHCSICRRASGAPFVAWFSVRSAAFRVLSGQPASFRSSAHGTRTFCPRCGTALTFQSSHFPDEIDVTICSLDDPALISPKDHTWFSAKLSWLRLADELPAFAEDRPSEEPRSPHGL